MTQVLPVMASACGSCTLMTGISRPLAERCDVIFREKASCKSTKGRPELEKACGESCRSIGKTSRCITPRIARLAA